MFETVNWSELETASEAYSGISGSSTSFQNMDYHSSALRLLPCSSRKESVFVLCFRFLISLEEVRATMFDGARQTSCWEVV